MAIVDKELSPNTAQSELAKVTHAELQLLNKKLKMQNGILFELAQSLLFLNYTKTNERQRKGLDQLIRVRANMLGMEVPGE